MSTYNVEVFATGTRTSRQGVTKVYTREDLQSWANEFNARQPKQKAPATIGHPTGTNALAYGWATEFSVKERPDHNGDPMHVLVGHFSEFVPGFVDGVKAGYLRGRSLGIRNGVIDHVAWLGAMPPAVKGLEDFTFAVSDEDHVQDLEEFSSDADDFSADYRVTTVSTILRRLRERLIETDGMELAERIIPNDDLDRLAEAPYDDTQWIENRLNYLEGLISGLREEPSSHFSEKTMDPKIKNTAGGESDNQDFSAQIAERDSKIESLETRNTALKTQLDDQGKVIQTLLEKNQESEFSTFLGSDDVRKRITPALRPIAMKMLKRAAEVDGNDFEFSEAGESKTGTALEAAKAEIKAWPELHLEEFATGGTSRESGSEQEEIVKRAQSIASAHKRS